MEGKLTDGVVNFLRSPWPAMKLEKQITEAGGAIKSIGKEFEKEVEVCTAEVIVKSGRKVFDFSAHVQGRKSVFQWLQRILGFQRASPYIKSIR